MLSDSCQLLRSMLLCYFHAIDGQSACSCTIRQLRRRQDARLFANNVRVLMAKHLQCSLSDFSTKVSTTTYDGEGFLRLCRQTASCSVVMQTRDNEASECRRNFY